MTYFGALQNEIYNAGLRGILPTYPVDFASSGTMRDFFGINRDLSRGLQETDQMTKEWVGLLASRLAGHTDALLPSP